MSTNVCNTILLSFLFVKIRVAGVHLKFCNVKFSVKKKVGI